MKLPKHIGIIMDGNGRWARNKGMPRTMGHRAGTNATREIVRAGGRLGLEYLTIYVFSAENWSRPPKEVRLLMDLLVEMIRREITSLNENNVRLHAIGDLGKLPERTREELLKGIAETEGNSGLNLILAISYGGRAEIVEAARGFARDASENPALIDELDEDMFAKYISSSNFPSPELIIRTGGEKRISNFLLWHAAYAELYMTDTLWPDFDQDCLMDALNDFSRRERRFGRVDTSE
jgi:undecaprenyl diphosphate synthase